MLKLGQFTRYILGFYNIEQTPQYKYDIGAHPMDFFGGTGKMVSLCPTG